MPPLHYSRRRFGYVDGRTSNGMTVLAMGMTLAALPLTALMSQSAGARGVASGVNNAVVRGGACFPLACRGGL